MSGKRNLSLDYWLVDAINKTIQLSEDRLSEMGCSIEHEEIKSKIQKAEDETTDWTEHFSSKEEAELCKCIYHALTAKNSLETMLPLLPADFLTEEGRKDYRFVNTCCGIFWMMHGLMCSNVSIEIKQALTDHYQANSKRMNDMRQERTNRAKPEAIRIATEFWEDELKEGKKPTVWGRVAKYIHDDRGVYLASLMDREDESPPAIVTIKKWIKETAEQYGANRRGRGDIKA